MPSDTFSEGDFESKKADEDEEKENDDESAALLDHGLRKEDERYALVDSALEKLGFGHFQYRVIALTGFGNFVDALEASLISILYPIFLATSFATSYTQLAMVSSLQAAGMLVGSATLGVFSDRLGRRTIYITSLSIVVLFGLISSFANDIVGFAILRFLLGFGYGGNNNTATSLMIEQMPINKRGIGSAFHGLFWGLGALTTASIAWIGGQNLDWRWLVRLPSIIAIPVLIAMFWLPESPRFHIHNDDNERLTKALTSIANQNGRPLPREATLSELNAARERSRASRIVESDNICVKLCSSMARLCTSRQYLLMMLPLYSIWLLIGIGHTVITWLPLHSLALLTPPVQTTVYTTAFVSAAGIVVGSFANFITGTIVTRQNVIRFGLVLSVGFMFGIAFSNSIEALYACAFFICLANQVTVGGLYLYTPELVATNVRSTGLGIGISLFRIGSIFAPFIAAVLTDSRSFLVTSCAFASFYVGALVASFFTRINTMNVPLKERASKHDA